MTDKERYETVDMPFYREMVEPILPPTILDFHVHVWNADQWLVGKTGSATPQNGASNGLDYMALPPGYSVECLIEDARRMFPGKEYRAVLFGQPSRLADIEMTNCYAEKSGRKPGLYPLFVTGRGRMPVDQLRERIVTHGFFGFKVLLDWIGDDYAGVSVEDMIGPAEMELANELGLIVLLHVPGSRRLADPRVQRSVREYAQRYPNTQIVLAHCGRCYLPSEMLQAIASVRDLENVYLDTAMVMEPSVMRIVFDNMDSRRLLYGTDLPMAAMRGRRVYAGDHWVDLVLDGYQPSAYRVPTSDVRASFMAYEIALAINVAGEMAGLSRSAIADVFCNNGIDLLRRVMGGRQWETIGSRWAKRDGAAEPTLTP